MSLVHPFYKGYISFLFIVGAVEGVVHRQCVAKLRAMTFGDGLRVVSCVQLLEAGWLAINGVRTGGLWRSGVLVMLCSM